MKLENVKFGDKFKTRDGRIAIAIDEHKISRHHWYDFVVIQEEGLSMLEGSPYKFSVHDTGIAMEDFTWLDIVEKI